MTNQKHVSVLVLSLTLLLAPPAFAGDCDAAFAEAIPVTKAIVTEQLKANLLLTDDDQIEVELTAEPSTLQYLGKYASGPRWSLNYGISVSVKLKNGTLIKEERAHQNEGAASFTWAEKPDKGYSCDLQAEWVDAPAMVEVVTRKKLFDHEECYAMSNHFWKTALAPQIKSNQ